MFFQDKYLLTKFRKTTFIDVVFFFSTYLYISLLSPYMGSLGLSESLKGIFFAVFGIIGMLVAPVIGTISDRLGRFRVIIAGLVFEIIALSGYMLATNAAELFIARVFAALGFSAVGLTAMARINDTINDDSKRARISGMFHSAISVAAMIAPPVGALIADTYGYTEVFLTSFIIISALLFGLVIYDYFKYNDNYQHRKKEHVKIRDVNPLAQIRDVLKDKDLRNISVLGMFSNATQPFLPLVIPYLIIEQMGLANFEVGIVFFIFGFAHIFQYPLGILSEKIGDRTSILIGVSSYALVYFLLAFTGNYFVLLGIVLIKAFGGSLWNVTAWSFMSKIAEKKNIEGKVVGSYAALSRLALSISFIVTGFLLPILGFYVLLIYGALVLTGILLTYKHIGRASVDL